MTLCIVPPNLNQGLEIPSGPWLGTDDALQVYMAAVKQAQSFMLLPAAQRPSLETDEEESEFGEYGHMLKRFGSVAVLYISGPIVTHEAWWHHYVGITSYQAIANAAITAANDRTITKLLLRVDTGGGTVNGIADCSETLREIMDTRIPIYTYVAGSMYSAGYWLGSIGKRIFLHQVAGAGSIGAKQIHMSYFRMLKEEGIDAKVFRSAEFKALGDPVEELTEKAAKTFQDALDYLDEVFTAEVARNRNTSVETVKQRMGRGLTFAGQRAIQAGLADELLSFEKVIARLQDTTNFTFTK